ncbi:MAG: hypothetical protein A2Y20_01630 [Firmicutes bacterium GWF2_51_9]|nr:MAG: hypothetical protein A2Y20_01630 [Firmicutes bacterium GWF2_51_9]OGS58600.1 MAG: hypothetical protein A2Y19_07900 [Firmicutes bacterium GWE2_51_13]
MKLRRAFTLFLSLFLLIAFPLSVAAGKPVKPATAVRYVGLGDSIGYGMSATPGNDYFTKYSAYLQAKAITAGSPYSSVNSALPGLTSSQLLDEITGTALLTTTRAALPGSSVVTVSIGGNNLLGPFISFVADLYGVSTSDPDFLNKLTLAVNADPGSLEDAMFWQILWPYSELNVAFAAGVVDFKADLPATINGIKGLAPNAKIYFLTVFNPVYGNSALHDFIDKYIVQINNELKAKASTYGYTVVDVYAAYASYTGTVPLVGFNMTAVPPTYDPHPTDAGHQVIYELLVSASTVPVKPGKPK